MQSEEERLRKKRENAAMWYAAHREKERESRRRYYYRNKEKYNALHKKWRDKNPEKYRKAHNISSNTSKTCKILEKHFDDLKDDPDHLTTEFIVKVCRIERKGWEESNYGLGAMLL